MNKNINIFILLFIIFVHSSQASAMQHLTAVKNYGKILFNGLFTKESFILLASIINAYSSVKSASYVMVDQSPVTKTFPKLTLENYAGDIDEAIKSTINLVKKNDNSLPIQKGFILHGSPGTGKTTLARCIAGELKCPFFEVNAADFNNKDSGGGEALLRGLFKQAREDAALHGTAVVLIDEFDAIGNKNDTKDNQVGVVATLLGLLDNKSDIEMFRDHMNSLLEKNAPKTLVDSIKIGGTYGGYDKGGFVIKYLLDLFKKFLSYIPIINWVVSQKEKKGNLIVIATTNDIEKIRKINPALMRSKRFDHLIKIGYPDEEKRFEIIKKTIGHGNDLNPLFQKIAKLTDGWSPADISSMLKHPSLPIYFSTLFSTQEQMKIKFTKAILKNRNMQIENPAERHERINVIDGYKKDHRFKHDCNYDELIGLTDNMSKKQIENIFEKSLLRAGNAFVTQNHIIDSYIEVEEIVKKEQKKHKEKVLNVLTALYPCSSEVNTQSVLPFVKSKKPYELNKLFKQAFKANKIVTLEGIKNNMENTQDVFSIVTNKISYDL